MSNFQRIAGADEAGRGPLAGAVGTYALQYRKDVNITETGRHHAQ